VLLGIGAIAWVMKLLKWPRPPLVLGFILGGLVERYMFISTERYGWSWLTHPVVMVMLAITLWGLLSPVVRGFLKRRDSRGGPALRWQPGNISPDLCFAALVFCVFAYAIWSSRGWDLGARLVPQVISWSGIFFTGAVIAINFLFAPAREATADGADGADALKFDPRRQKVVDTGHLDLQTDFSDLTLRQFWGRAASYFLWLLGYLGMAAVVGMLPAMLLFLVGYMRFQGGERWSTALKVGGIAWIAAYGLFHLILVQPWPQTLLGDVFPELRSIHYLNLF